MEMLDEIKVEEMDDSDMEYLDVPYVDNDENDEDSFIQEDSDIDPDFNPENEPEADYAGADEVRKRRGRPRSKNPKKKRPLAEMRPRKCHHCSAVLTGISSLNSHIKRVHLKEKKYPCHICGYAFFTTTHREDHIISVHTRKCGKCNKDVIETTPWIEGMEKTNIRMVDCSCGNSVSVFSKVGRVRGFREDDDGTKPKRKRAASEVTPIECEHCGLTLIGRSSLYSHIRRQHLKTRNFKCTVCGKEFYTSTHLQCHILSVHTRKCQSCQEFVMETEPWSESMDKKQMRKVTCKCGAEVTIFTKLGPKHRTEGSKPKRKKSEESADTRYVCGSCGKIFLRKSNAMSHTCVEKEDITASTTNQSYADKTDFTNETDESQTEDVRKTQLLLEPDSVQYKMEGGNLVIAEGSQVVTFEGEEGQSISDVAGIQIMHEGKLVPAEHMVDEHGNVSFIIKQIE